MKNSSFDCQNSYYFSGNDFRDISGYRSPEFFTAIDFSWEGIKRNLAKILISAWIAGRIASGHAGPEPMNISGF